ncbi:MAG: hypothetical protein M3Q27_15560 [Actinomycetota bacterium]|nr:hypothetical protein [Actinomycetota bacterium]
MTTPEPESRTWYARICCPSCYGPVRVRPHEKEGRCRGCRPIRQHSRPRREQTSFLKFLEGHQAATQ